ncbi:MAG: hypothetical protein PHC75_01385 [Burkholderiales bacterium]|nr:hypothetical protein [Burkholderiales bacterium]
MLRSLSRLCIAFFLVFDIICVYADDNSAPQVYQPTYIYGATPGGVYMGDPYDLGDGMYMPDGETMREHQTQDGEQEQGFQYMQGQEELMADHSKEAVATYKDEQVIGNQMENQYQKQIDTQTNEQAPQAIVLPSM